jgi:hypothetical protein
MRINKILAVLLAIVLVACDTVDFGDTNANNNGPSAPYPAGMLAGAIMTYATQTGRVGLMQPTLYVQYQSQVTYTDEMRYNEVPTDWVPYYRDMLIDLQGVIKFNSEPSNLTPTVLAQGAPENQIGVAMIMKAIIMKRVTDTWGDVPFSEALKGDGNFNASYDTQEDIYTALIADLKAGRDMLDETKVLPKGDIIYGGDVTMWKKLANSVVMQMAITLSKKMPGPAGFAATEFNSALNHADGIIDDVSEEAWFQFEDIQGFRNPWNANRTPDYFLSKQFTDALNGNAALNPTSNTTFDSRIKVYADDFTKPGVPYGFENGSGAGAASVSNVNYWNNTTPLPMMTASYVYLNRAHAAALGWTSEVIADMLTEGIEKSYETLDEHFGTSISADAATYAAARVVDAGVVGNLRVIAEEKWVSLFGMGFDAWTEWRVTGFPVLTPATDYLNNGQIPRRYLYPTEESTLNEAMYNQGVARLSPTEDRNTSKVWWDQ